jgi:hypothetical protein
MVVNAAQVGPATPSPNSNESGAAKVIEHDTTRLTTLRALTNRLTIATVQEGVEPFIYSPLIAM